MKKWNLGGRLVCALLAVMALALPASAYDPGLPGAQTRTAPVMLIPQDTGVHVKYMDGSGGWFYPEQNVTRAELAQMLAGVVADVPASAPWFSDVAPDAWYAYAVQRAAGLGMMGGENSLFRPNAPATRAEFAAALVMVIPYSAWTYHTFPDVQPGYWAYDAICRVAGYGLFLGDGTGYFHPDDGLKRCEAVTVLNRLLGRTPDMAYIHTHSGLRTFPDVPESHWAYWDIMEAAVTHQCGMSLMGSEQWTFAVSEPSPVVEQPSLSTAGQPYAPVTDQTYAPALADGPQRINGRLYWVSGGEFVRSQNMDGLYFDENGCYTTGNEELDERLNAIVEELTDDSMTRDQKLEVLFNYVRDNYTYLKRPIIAKGQTGWEPEYALAFLKNGKGNCYSFSATYCLLCQELGLPAYTVVGSVFNGPHGWVEIVLDGSVYLFDTQLAWRYLHDWGRTGYNFFKVSIKKTPVKYTW